MITPIERFQAKYEPEPNTGCWIWHGAQSECGNGHFYGFFWDHETKKQVGAHVWAAKCLGGLPIEDGQVNHKCDLGLCVNPDHMYVGTQKQNVADAHRRGRKKSGAECSFSKLTDNQVRAIRVLSDEGETWAWIADLVQVEQHLVDDVLRGKGYKNVL